MDLLKITTGTEEVNEVSTTKSTSLKDARKIPSKSAQGKFIIKLKKSNIRVNLINFVTFSQNM